MSKFLLLPQELRDEILRLAVLLPPRASNSFQGKPADKPITARYSESTGAFYISGPSKLFLASSALLLTSRQLHFETTAVLDRLGESASKYDLEIRCVENSSFQVRWRTVPSRSSKINLLKVRFVVPSRPDPSGSMNPLLRRATNNLVWLCHRLIAVYILKDFGSDRPIYTPHHIKTLHIDTMLSRHADPRFAEFQARNMSASALGKLYNEVKLVAKLYTGLENRYQTIIETTGKLKFTEGALVHGIDFHDMLERGTGTEMDLTESFLKWKEGMHQTREKNGLGPESVG